MSPTRVASLPRPASSHRCISGPFAMSFAPVLTLRQADFTCDRRLIRFWHWVILDSHAIISALAPAVPSNEDFVSVPQSTAAPVAGVLCTKHGSDLLCSVNCVAHRSRRSGRLRL
eukprot:gene56-biopygen177